MIKAEESSALKIKGQLVFQTFHTARKCLRLQK